MKVKCNSCDLDIYVADNPRKVGASFRENKIDNRRFAFASNCVGLDYHQLAFLCALLNIPGPPHSYDVHQTEIHKHLEDFIQQKLLQNRVCIDRSANHYPYFLQHHQ